jgi:hypothetical protein
MFSKNIRTVYLYAVCFITLMMAIGGIIATVNAVANYCLPVVFAPYHFDRTESAAEAKAIDERRMEEDRKAQFESERIRNLRSIFSSSAVWLIAGPVFAFHWRRLRAEESGNGDDKP